VAAELANRDLERRAGTQRRLVEQQRDVAAVEQIARRCLPSERTIRLHLRGDLQATLEVRGLEVEHRQEVFPHGNGLCHVR
jgi:hypothetical protein